MYFLFNKRYQSYVKRSSLNSIVKYHKKITVNQKKTKTEAMPASNKKTIQRIVAYLNQIVDHGSGELDIARRIVLLVENEFDNQYSPFYVSNVFSRVKKYLKTKCGDRFTNMFYKNIKPSEKLRRARQMKIFSRIQKQLSLKTS